MSKEKLLSPTVFAAGSVVLRGAGKKTEVLLVHRNLRDDWSIPKGKLEPGELMAAAAFRETHEETGLRVRLGMPLSAIRYMSLGKPKLVRYWVAQSLDPAIDAGDKNIPDDFYPNDEVDEVRWVRASQIKGILSYSQDIALVEQALSLPRYTSPLILLRHAEAEKREAFAQRHDGNPPADDYRPLTPFGFRQTPAIAAALRAFGIEQIYSSPATRCVSTVAPEFVADHKVITEPSFSEWGIEKNRAATKERIREVRETAQPLVICSHRPVLPTLVKAIAGKSGDLHPSRKLKPGDFAVFHRSSDHTARLRKFNLLAVEHSNEEF
ncbi:MAG: hypothetical protein RL410_1348 [Actinomycetota bacterium]